MTLLNINKAVIVLSQWMALLCSIIILTACQTVPHSIEKVTGEPVEIKELENFVSHRMEELNVPGLSLAVINDGEIVYQGAFGVKNRSTGEKLTNQTVFEAASLSKPLFAYFVMLQVKKGLIGLDEPLYQYHPNKNLLVDKRHQLITARMLLTHTSGLPNWRKHSGAELELSFMPGTQFQYSGEGYEYLRRVLQELLATDDDGLQMLLEEEAVEAIGSDFMKYNWDERIPSRKAFGHRNDVPTDNHKHDHNFGASYSLNTTAEDYAKFLVALMRPVPAKKEMVETFLKIQDQMPNEEGEMHRSLGFPVKQTEHGIRYYHSGNNGDFRAYCHFYKKRGFGVVLYSNSDKLFSSNLAEEIVEYLGDTWFYM
ncbi:serine hydrolase domain-containing protein [Kangiella koreensis]|nr:serine hydrolase domain-containing protein [Kangiella koreensis]